MGMRRKKSQKTKDLIESEKVIDLDAQREARRKKLRAEAEASRKKRGEKSIKQQVQEEISLGDQPAVTLVEEKTKKKKRRKALSLKAKLCLLAIIVALIIMLFSMGNIISLKMQEKDAKQTVSQLEKEKEELERQVGELGTQEYIEQQARDWLKMAQQGEIIYDFSDRNGHPGTPSTITGDSALDDSSTDGIIQKEGQ